MRTISLLHSFKSHAAWFEYIEALFPPRVYECFLFSWNIGHENHIPLALFQTSCCLICSMIWFERQDKENHVSSESKHGQHHHHIARSFEHPSM